MIKFQIVFRFLIVLVMSAVVRGDAENYSILLIKKAEEETRFLTLRSRQFLNDGNALDAKALVDRLGENRRFYLDLSKGKYGQELEMSFSGTVPHENEYAVLMFTPFILLNDVAGYLRVERSFKTYDGEDYWLNFPGEYAQGGWGDDTGKAAYQHPYAATDLKRRSVVMARKYGTKRESDQLDLFWTSPKVVQGLVEWGLSDLGTEPKGLNVYSWYHCNKRLFSGDGQGALTYCAQYAQLNNYYDPKRYRNREYALALLFAGQSDKAEQQFALYKAASGEKQTLMQLADPAVYPAARKLHKLPELASCAARYYGQEHLRDHPKQQVTGIRMAKQQDGAVTLGIQLRDAPTWHESMLTCQGREPQHCQIACNGGSVTVARKDGRIQLKNQGINLKACSSQALLIDPEQDQQVFLLDSAAPARCYAF